ncbi:hypothetical protein C8Q78DRAFT_748444 [Trametes maxima]|nr:hypothetical protein C8Q78DRAFT_748444 [Trametes maxima]
MENCRVPIEVCEHIIDLLGADCSSPWDEERKTMRACTLVCSAWRERSRYHSYRSILRGRVLVPSLSSCRSITSLVMRTGHDQAVTLIQYWYILRAVPQLKRFEVKNFDSDHHRFQALPHHVECIKHMQPKVCLQKLLTLRLWGCLWSLQKEMPLSRLFGTSVTDLYVEIYHPPSDGMMIQYLSSLNSLHSLTVVLIHHDVTEDCTNPIAQALSSAQLSTLQVLKLKFLPFEMGPYLLSKGVTYGRTKADFLNWVFKDVKPLPRLRKLEFEIVDNSADKNAASTWWESQIWDRLQDPNLDISINLILYYDDDCKIYLWAPLADIPVLSESNLDTEDSSSEYAWVSLHLLIAHSIYAGYREDS